MANPAGKTPRQRAREHVESLNNKSKELLDAVKETYDENVAAMKGLADAALADEPPTAGEYAGEVITATVNAWGSYLGLYDKVVKMCLKPKS
jgi:hypothetical protein